MTSSANDTSGVHPDPAMTVPDRHAPLWLLLAILASALVLAVRTGIRLLAASAGTPTSTLRSDFLLDVALICMACTLLAAGRLQRFLSVVTAVVCVAAVVTIFVK